MAKKGPSIAKLNILLLKTACKQFEDALREEHSLSEVKLKSTIGEEAALYVKKPHTNPPTWAKFLKPVASGTLDLANASSSAVLFVRASKRVFAFCFGQGRSELKNDVAEPSFGLKVALNTVHPSKLRSANARTLEHGVTTRQLQTSRDADQTAFGFDIARDLLRQIAGQPEDESLGTKVVGSDSLTLHARVTAGGLGEKCKKLLQEFRSKKYKKEFDWVDHLAAVNDPGLRQKLDEKLTKAFASGEHENMHLAATSIIDWDRVDNFKIEGAGRAEFVDLDLPAYYAAIKKPEEFTLQKLKSHKIRARFAGSENYQPQGTVYSSLVWETKLNSKLHALVDGNWYTIDKTYAEQVAAFVQSIPAPDPDYLPNTTPGEAEGTYNERAADESAEVFLLDKRLVKPEGASTKIEFCDLFSKAKQLIHVKRKTRSATLSHLFAQGVVSAELFLQDMKVREQVKDHMREHAPNGGFLGHIPDSRPAAEDYEVVYAIAAKPNDNWPLSLPFFSQVNLKSACERLEAFGYRYSLVLVEALEAN